MAYFNFSQTCCWTLTSKYNRSCWIITKQWHIACICVLSCIQTTRTCSFIAEFGHANNMVLLPCLDREAEDVSVNKTKHLLGNKFFPLQKWHKLGIIELSWHSDTYSINWHLLNYWQICHDFFAVVKTSSRLQWVKTQT